MFKVALKITKEDLIIIDNHEKLSTDAQIVGFFHSLIEELLELNKKRIAD